MKLATFKFDGAARVGVVVDNGIVELSTNDSLPSSMEGLLALGASGLDASRRIADDGDPIPLDRVELLAPVCRPRKFLAIAANYQSHIDEVKRTIANYSPPTSQRWFNKQVSCVNGPFEPIVMPFEGCELDYEAELAVVIGTRCRRVPAADARAVIAGYTICNDISVRDWQRRSPTITLGKSFDTHGPLGPWLVTPDEISDPHDLEIRCSVNGELRQKGSTGEMIYNCFEQIAYLSTVFTLEPGDVIATGTPAGTGASMDPPGLLQVGDAVRCEIDGIGAIEASITTDGQASL